MSIRNLKILRKTLNCQAYETIIRKYKQFTQLKQLLGIRTWPERWAPRGKKIGLPDFLVIRQPYSEISFNTIYVSSFCFGDFIVNEGEAFVNKKSDNKIIKAKIQNNYIKFQIFQTIQTEDTFRRKAKTNAYLLKTGAFSVIMHISQKTGGILF